MSRNPLICMAASLVVSIPLGSQLAAAQQLAAVEPRFESHIEEAPEPSLSDWSLKVCSLIDSAATAHGLPKEFLTRLIWQESRFKAKAVSPAGARGIAQFMPGTASDRDLEDPFDPLAAIVASASLLRDLREQFGNLGLAAAAYNGGPGRVSDWIGGDGGLPRETRNYVWIITGHVAESWSKKDARKLEVSADGGNLTSRACEETVAMLQTPGDRPEMPDDVEDEFESASGPWGVQVAGSFSRTQAVAAWQRMKKEHSGLLGDHSPMMVGGKMRSRGTRPFYRVRVAAETRDQAESLCGKLKSAGGVCVVLKN